MEKLQLRQKKFSVENKYYDKSEWTDYHSQAWKKPTILIIYTNQKCALEFREILFWYLLDKFP